MTNISTDSRYDLPSDFCRRDEPFFRGALMAPPARGALISVIINTRNTEGYIERCLDSLLQQTVTDWVCLLTDDLSEDGTFDKVISIVGDDSRFLLRKNYVRRYATFNFLQSSRMCDPNSIIVALDGDDWLTGPQSLQVVLESYEDSGVESTHGGFEVFYGDRGRKSSGAYQFYHYLDRTIPPFDPKDPEGFIQSHLRSFRGEVLDRIPRYYYTSYRKDGSWEKKFCDLIIHDAVCAVSKKVAQISEKIYTWNISHDSGHDWDYMNYRSTEEEDDLSRHYRGLVRSLTITPQSNSEGDYIPSMLMLGNVGPSKAYSGESSRLYHIIQALISRVDITVVFPHEWDLGSSIKRVRCSHLGPETLPDRPFNYIWVQSYEVLYDNNMYQHITNKYPSASIIINTIDIHWKRYSGGAALGYYQDINLVLEKEKEIRAYREMADQLIVVGPHDQEQLEQEGICTPMLNIPIILPDEEWEACGTSYSGYFIGGFSHEPNIASLLWFLREVFPLILRRMPDFVLKVIGSNIDRLKAHHDFIGVEHNYRANIQIIGHIEDVRKHIRGSVCISPVLFGSGMKSKVAEALGYGSPVIGTPKSFEGYEDLGELAVSSFDSAEMADLVVKISNNTEKFRELSTLALRISSAWRYSQWKSRIRDVIYTPPRIPESIHDIGIIQGGSTECATVIWIYHRGSLKDIVRTLESIGKRTNAAIIVAIERDAEWEDLSGVTCAYRNTTRSNRNKCLWEGLRYLVRNNEATIVECDSGSIFTYEDAIEDILEDMSRKHLVYSFGSDISNPTSREVGKGMAGHWDEPLFPGYSSVSCMPVVYKKLVPDSAGIDAFLDNTGSWSNDTGDLYRYLSKKSHGRSSPRDFTTYFDPNRERAKGSIGSDGMLQPTAHSLHYSGWVDSRYLEYNYRLHIDNIENLNIIRGPSSLSTDYIFVVCYRNQEEKAARCIESIIKVVKSTSSGSTSGIIIVDDFSTDIGYSPLIKALEVENIPYIFIRNKERKYFVRNLYNVVNLLVTRDDTVIIEVDGDDYLNIDLDTLSILDREYSAGALKTFGSFLVTPEGNSYFDILSKEGIPHDLEKLWDSKYCVHWAHLKTYVKSLFMMVPLTCFTEIDTHQWLIRADDNSVAPRMMELAGIRAHFVPEKLYVYDHEGYAHDYLDLDQYPYMVYKIDKHPSDVYVGLVEENSYTFKDALKYWSKGLFKQSLNQTDLRTKIPLATRRTDIRNKIRTRGKNV